MIYLSKTKQTECKKDIIIKTIEKEKIADCQLAIEYAKRESAVLTRLDHPNIIKVFHTAETEGQFMIFMEYAGFGSNYLSKKVLLNQKAVREDKLQCWAQDVLYALSYMHEKGVVHNDIKLDNILIQS